MRTAIKSYQGEGNVSTPSQTYVNFPLMLFLKRIVLRLILIFLCMSFGIQTTSMVPRTHLLAPTSVLAEIYEQTVFYIAAQHELNKQLVPLWLEFNKRELDPAREDHREEIFSYVKRLLVIIKKSDALILAYAPYIKKLGRNSYALILHFIANGPLRIMVNLHMMGERGWELEQDYPSTFYEYKGKVVTLIRLFLERQKEFYTIVQKGELLNILEHSDDPDVMHIEKLHDLPVKVALPKNLFTEIDSLINTLGLNTSL